METPTGATVPTWVALAFGTAISALSSALVYVFKMDKAESQKLLLETQQRHTTEISELKATANTLRQDVKDCSTDREELRVRLATVETKLELLGVDQNDHGKRNA
jgi:FtsZ-binding cell division protein ZapB